VLSDDPHRVGERLRVALANSVGFDEHAVAQ
jgi:hypothetical protein